jgi:hypothetical protein
MSKAENFNRALSRRVPIDRGARAIQDGADSPGDVAGAEPDTLPMIAPSDFIALGRQCRARRKQELRDNCRSAGLSAELTVRLLNEFDSRPWRHADTIGFIETEEGAAAAVLCALRKDHPGAGEADLDALGIAPGRMLAMAAAVCGLALVQDNRSASEESPRPFDPAGAGPVARSATVTGDLRRT